jgi:threonine dehydrogenase-like Zn-dependent dehydrogenase
MSALPETYQALLVEAVGEDLQIQARLMLEPIAGSAVVQILSAVVLSYHREIYNGTRPYPLSLPMVAGLSAIGRVSTIGDDAALLQPGQLVYVDCVVRGRDDPSARFLCGIHEGFSKGARKLSRGMWKHGTFSEYARMPLENCIPLNETRLCQELGYTIQELAYIAHLLVPFGGLRDIKLEPGETVVVCPATGGYGGAAVQVALAMGARVIAMGRNEKELARMKAMVLRGTPLASIETVRISGDEQTDTAVLQTFGGIDAILDLSPPAAAQSTHLRSAISTLRRGGRVSLMGYTECRIIDWKVMSDNITLKGKLMYEREDMLLFVKMLERGLFPKSGDLVDVKIFELKDWKEAFDVAAEHTGIGKVVVIEP